MRGNRIIVIGTPWWRGFMPRSYTAPHCIASFGCSVYLIAFGIFFVLGGTITIVSKYIAESERSHSEDPTFNDPFFKNVNENRKANSIFLTNTMRKIGIALISVGAIFIIAAITICCFARYYVKKHERNPQNEGLRQLSGYCPPPLPESYPQQPAPPPGSYPQYQMPASGAYPPPYTPGSYPQQPVITSTSHPQQFAPQDSYPYPPSSQPTTLESQMPNNASAPPAGLKE